jgi:hypothetical protein
MQKRLDICCSIPVIPLLEDSDRGLDCPTDAGLTGAKRDTRNTGGENRGHSAFPTSRCGCDEIREPLAQHRASRPIGRPETSSL